MQYEDIDAVFLKSGSVDSGHRVEHETLQVPDNRWSVCLTSHLGTALGSCLTCTQVPAYTCFRSLDTLICRYIFSLDIIRVHGFPRGTSASVEEEAII